MEPELYDEFGELINKTPKPIVYERKLDTYQQHVIHATKDLFDGNCFLCQKDAKKRWNHISKI